MSGRGNLLSLFHKGTDASEPSISSGEIGKDSGLDLEHSLSSGEFRRIGRNEISRDLTSAFVKVNVSMGRGRANFLQCFKCNSQSLENNRQLQSFSSDQIDFANITDTKNFKTCETYVEHMTPDDNPQNVSRSGLFCPNITQGIKGNKL